MILLLGGTSDSVQVAEALTQAGFPVLLSTLTALPFGSPIDPKIRRRSGRLDAPVLKRLVTSEQVKMVVDATHPYSREIQTTARRMCMDMHLPYIRYDRPPAVPESAPVLWAESHEQAARLVGEHGKPTLLTIGTRHLQPYVACAKARSIPLFVRVLEHPDAQAAAKQAGIPPANIITSRPPCTFEENLSHIGSHHIEVLVTKDSGRQGGVEAKLLAASRTGCKVIAVRRPEQLVGCLGSVNDIVPEVARHLSKGVSDGS